MRDWIEQLDVILKRNKKELLTHAGRVSHQRALEKSSIEYGKCKIGQSKIERISSLEELEQDIDRLRDKK